MKKGRFFVFEGLDSAVLAEQASLLEKWLRSRGAPVLVTREPTNGPVGAVAQQVSNGRLTIEPQTRAILFLADRLDHLFGPSQQSSSGILAQLEKGTQVICTHYLLHAYTQPGVDPGWLRQINQPCPWPDLVFLIHSPIPTDPSLGERYDQAIFTCSQHGEKVIVIENGLSAEAIHQRCCNAIEQLESEHSPCSPTHTPEN